MQKSITDFISSSILFYALYGNIASFILYAIILRDAAFISA